MSTYWVTGADIFSRATELMSAEANPVAAGRAAVERFGFLRLDWIELVAASSFGQ
jgi:hypothetical protein